MRRRFVEPVIVDNVFHGLTEWPVYNKSVNYRHEPLAFSQQQHVDKKLLRAARGGQALRVSHLLQEGADVDSKDDDGWSVLHHACGHKSRGPDLVSALVDAGAYIDARTNSNYTPLHIAVATSQNDEVVKLLVLAGADVNARNHSNETPLHIATRTDGPRSTVSRILREAGAMVVDPPKQQSHVTDGAVKLLSIDGGGVRGLSALVILEQVMDMVNHVRKQRGLEPQEPWQLFDMIGGSGTGG